MVYPGGCGGGSRQGSTPSALARARAIDSLSLQPRQRCEASDSGPAAQSGPAQFPHD
jgi:hypothetical protein